MTPALLPRDSAETPAPERTEKRRDIQALRAVAVMAVFVYHLVPGALPGGFIGVDVFFVVSGFLVGGMLVTEVEATGRVALLRFYARRVRRIAPLAALVAVATIAFFAATKSPIRLILWGSPADLPTATRDGLASVSGVANLWFGASDVGYAMNAYVSPFRHYWSLGVEEQFYLVAPVAIALALKAGRQAGVLVVAAMTVLTFDLATAGIATMGLGTFYSPVSRAWELGLGVLAAMAVPWARGHMAGGRIAGGAVWVSWMAMGAFAVVTALPRDWPTTSSIIPVGATAFILVVGTARGAGRLASVGVLQWLGDRSYGIYLWHWPVVALAAPLWGLSLPLTVALTLAVTLTLSAASYRWVELPFRRRSVASPPAVRRTLLAGTACVTGALVVFVAIGTWASLNPSNAGVVAERYRLLPAGVPAQEFATRVPQNLRPGLLEASTDKPIAYEDGCNVVTLFDSIDMTDCIYGTTGPLVALYGDSHALQWLGALLPAANRGEIRVALVTADACPPFDPTSLDYREVCTAWYQSAVARLNSLEPDLVVASASLSEPALEGDASMALASQALRALPSALDGARVLWIADTPAFDEVPSDCAADDVTDIGGCSMSRDKALAPLKRAPFEQAVVANGWHTVDLSDYMCDASECGIILGDVFMYRDDDHLTTTFASELSAVLVSAVLPLVDGGDSP